MACGAQALAARLRRNRGKIKTQIYAVNQYLFECILAKLREDGRKGNSVLQGALVDGLGHLPVDRSHDP